MGIISRILGISKTKPPENPGCWAYRDGRIELKLAETPELSVPGGAVRLEGRGLPMRVLVFLGKGGKYFAFQNRCTHAGRRLDPLPSLDQVQCCSVNKTTFTLDGQVVSGAGKQNAVPLPVSHDDGTLWVELGKDHKA